MKHVELFKKEQHGTYLSAHTREIRKVNISTVVNHYVILNNKHSQFLPLSIASNESRRGIAARQEEKTT